MSLVLRSIVSRSINLSRPTAVAVRGYASDNATVKVDIENCHDSLEWVVPSPPNFHTFDELPIIKESENEGHEE